MRKLGLTTAVLLKRGAARAALCAALAAGVALPACGGAAEATRSERPKKQSKAATADDLLDQALEAEHDGKPTIAEQKFTRALKIRPDHHQTVDSFVAFLLAEKRFKDAIEIAKAFIERAPGELDGYRTLGDAYLAAGEASTAYGTFTQYIELDDQNPQAWERRGRALLKMTRPDEAIADMRKAVSFDAKNPKYLVALGEALYRGGKDDESALNLRSAVQIDEENVEAHLLLGIILREQREIQEALVHHLRAAKFGERRADAYFELGITQNMMRDNLAAELSFARAVELEPSNATNWYAYGEILRALGKFKESVPAYKKSLELDPPHPKAANKLGMVLFQAGQLDEAEVVLTAAIRKDASDASPYLSLGRVYGEAKKYQLGIEASEKFLELADKNDPEVGEARKLIQELKKRAKRDARR